MIDKDASVASSNTNGHGSSFSTFKTSGTDDLCDQQHRQRRSVNFSDPVVAPLCGDEVLCSEAAIVPGTTAAAVVVPSSAPTPPAVSTHRYSSLVSSTSSATAVYSGLTYKQASSSSSVVGGGKPTGSYRLASLDRLAQRHKLYSSLDSAPAVSPLTLPPTSGKDEVASTTSQQQHHTVSMSNTSMLYNKREMFFRGETPASPASSSTTAAPANSSHVTAGGTAKEAHSHANGRDKENRPETSQGSGVSRSGSTAAHTAPPASAAAADSTTTGHQPLTSAPSGGGGGKSVAAVTARLAAAAAASSGGGRRARQLDGYVGFANLPNQVYRRAVKRGFHFTMMVVGEAGLGKSTLVNSMFMTELYASDFPGPSMRVKKTVAVEKTVVQLKETGVNLTLTIVDTPGFGDAVDNSNCWQPVIEYIEQQYESYLNAESRIHRTEPVDTRVHCCLYFIGPSGHNLKPLDVEFMRRLHDKVNIIPVIAKADTMTPEEVMHFKKQVLNEITQHKIRIYEFPDCEDEDENRAQRLLRDRVPFAVVGANTIVDVDGKKVRGRRYPWGTVQVDNMEHSDFIPLRNMLVRTHMMDMCAVTSNVHYENYRARALSINLTGDSKSNRIVNKNPLAQMEEEKREHEQKIKKMEEEMQQVFEMKVKEKKNKLKDTERDINDHERHLLGQLEDQRRMLQSRRADLEKKCRDWQISMEDLRRKDDKEGVDGKKKRKGIF